MDFIIITFNLMKKIFFKKKENEFLQIKEINKKIIEQTPLKEKGEES